MNDVGTFPWIIGTLITTIGVIAGIVRYLYRQNEKQKQREIDLYRQALDRAKAETETLRADISTQQERILQISLSHAQINTEVTDTIARLLGTVEASAGDLEGKHAEIRALILELTRETQQINENVTRLLANGRSA